MTIRTGSPHPRWHLAPHTPHQIRHPAFFAQLLHHLLHHILNARFITPSLFISGFPISRWNIGPNYLISIAIVVLVVVFIAIVVPISDIAFLSL